MKIWVGKKNSKSKKPRQTWILPHTTKLLPQPLNFIPQVLHLTGQLGSFEAIQLDELQF
jgi:hypothetical protein